MFSMNCTCQQKFVLLPRAIQRENIMLQCLEKEIATAKKLDLRPLAKVIIFRDKQTDKQNLPIIYRYHHYYWSSDDQQGKDSAVMTSFATKSLGKVPTGLQIEGVRSTQPDSKRSWNTHFSFNWTLCFLDKFCNFIDP